MNLLTRKKRFSKFLVSFTMFMNYLLVIGDAKTFELLRKDEYGQDLWIIPYPGDWYILRNFQQVFFKSLAMLGFGPLPRRQVLKRAL